MGTTMVTVGNNATTAFSTSVGTKSNHDCIT